MLLTIAACITASTALTSLSIAVVGIVKEKRRRKKNKITTTITEKL
ncbi:MAG: hypothetical protein RLZZ540_666 [Bacteroidota bacterium]|jgi:hypothetical protein